MATTIIAEMCNNHCGSMEIAEAMIRAAASAGADACKFQSFRADKLRKDYPDYEKEYAYYKKHELSYEDHVFLMQKCQENGVEFITTVFDLDTVDMLKELGLKTVKIASPDANSWRLIDKCLANFEQVIISTGMHTWDEIDKLRDYCAEKQGETDVTILYCVSEYPTPIGKIRLGIINRIKIPGKINSGFSDHTEGTQAAKIAIAMGADVIEKHFTLNQCLPGKDQRFAGTYEDFIEITGWRNLVSYLISDNGNLDKTNRAKYQGRWGCNV